LLPSDAHARRRRLRLRLPRRSGRRRKLLLRRRHLRLRRRHELLVRRGGVGWRARRRAARGSGSGAGLVISLLASHHLPDLIILSFRL
jgi:hypothetical protein